MIIWFSNLSDKDTQIGVDSGTLRPKGPHHKRSIVPKRDRLAARRAALSSQLPFLERIAAAGPRRSRPCAYRSLPTPAKVYVHPDLEALRIMGYDIKH